ncbi:MAG: chloride channel protein [Geitlerinemataceae cyanobacterium]
MHHSLIKVWQKIWQVLANPSTGVASRRVALFQACTIGIVSGLAAFFLRQGIGWVGGLRVAAAEDMAWFVLPLFGAIGAGLAGIAIVELAPQAKGSGLPYIKLALAPRGLAQSKVVMNLRTAIVKLVATIAVAGSGLVLGRQGPTVYVGATLAAVMTRWFPTSPAFRRQTIAAGAAAGLAAGFNAPIAGVLFVIEELLRDMSSLTLETAILASFIGAVVSRLLGGNTWSLDPEVLPQFEVTFEAIDIPFLLLLGVMAGVLSGWFNRCAIASLEWNRRLNWSLPKRMALAGLLSGTIVCLLPVAFRDSTALRELLQTGDVGLGTLVLALVAEFVMTTIAFGSGASGGVFAPALTLGAALGALIGTLTQLWLGLGNPTTYALAGMGGFFGAVSKVPITAIAIVFEMTMNFNIVLPLMVVVLVSNVVSERLWSGSLDDRIYKLSGLKQNESQPEREYLSDLEAGAVMQRRVETLPEDLKMGEVRQRFARSKHRGFPVLRDGKLVGMVTHSDLIDRVQSRDEVPLSQVMTRNPVSVQSSGTLADVLYRLNYHKIGRLPVVEGRRLVGIITRSDIIRTEFRQLDLPKEIDDRVDPSYLIYRTQAPSSGRGRMLVALSDPARSAALVRLAAEVARSLDYELECLHVVTVPQHIEPSEADVDFNRHRRDIETVAAIAGDCGVATHAQIRVAHDIVPTILETLRYRRIDRLVMGWSTEELAPGQFVGARIDRLLRRVRCDVMLVKWGEAVKSAARNGAHPHQSRNAPAEAEALVLDRWLVPVAGGQNAKLGLDLLPGLLSLAQKPAVRLCRVFDPQQVDLRGQELRDIARDLSERIELPVSATPLVGHSVVERTISIAHRHKYDVVLLGASEQKSIQQALRGNIPYEIARGCKATVILVRGARSETEAEA